MSRAGGTGMLSRAGGMMMSRVGAGTMDTPAPTVMNVLQFARPGTSLVTGRQVQDRSYWSGILKTKISLIETEIARLQGILEATERESSCLGNLEARMQQEAAELRELQGVLGDYNTLVDKIHMDADLEEMNAQTRELEIENLKTQAKVDAIFMKRKELERLQQEQDQLKIRDRETMRTCVMDQGTAEQRSRWLQLEQQLAKLNEESSLIKAKTMELQNSCQQNEDKIKKDPQRFKIWQVLETQRTLAQQLVSARAKWEPKKIIVNPGDHVEDLDAWIASCTTKEELLQVVRHCNAEIQKYESDLSNGDSNDNVNLGASISDQDKEQASGAHGTKSAQADASEKTAKYEELCRRDKEMTTFLEQAPQQITELKQKIEATQNEVVRLLLGMPELALPTSLASLVGGHVDTESGNDNSEKAKTEKQLKNKDDQGSNGALASKGSVGAAAAAAELNRMTDQLVIKRRETEQAACTEDAITRERERLAGDLARVETLEARLAEEIKTARTRIAGLEEDIKRFSKGDEDCDKLVSQCTETNATCEELRSRLTELSRICEEEKSRVDALRLQLESNPMHVELRDAEETAARLENEVAQVQKSLDMATAGGVSPHEINELQKAVSECLDSAATLARMRGSAPKSTAF